MFPKMKKKAKFTVNRKKNINNEITQKIPFGMSVVRHKTPKTAH